VITTEEMFRGMGIRPHILKAAFSYHRVGLRPNCDFGL
jgi:hypothetical protein